MLPPHMGAHSMRSYFFDLRDERGNVIDDEGVLLPTLEAVQDEAARALGQLR